MLGVPSRRIVYHSQDFLEPGRYRFWEFFERRFARRAGHVILNEENRARFMASHYRLGQVPTVVRTALPAVWPQPETRTAERDEILKRAGRFGESGIRIIVTLGPVNSRRGGRPLLEAFADLPSNYLLVSSRHDPNDPAGKEVQEGIDFLKSRGVENRAVFLDEMPYGELLQLASACDIGILLYPADCINNYYQAPGRLTEYLSCGLPMVTSAFPGLELLFLKTGIGTACDPTSSSEIAAAIRRLGERGDDEIASERKRLRLLARTDLAYDAQAGRIEAIVREALGGEN